jgi:hypothetical protein
MGPIPRERNSDLGRPTAPAARAARLTASLFELAPALAKATQKRRLDRGSAGCPESPSHAQLRS